MQNLIQFWVYGTFPAALLLLGLFPAFLSAGSFPLGLIYLQIPFYMLHQVEEHASGRFGRFVNQTVGHGKEILTPTAIFWINVPGVWGISLTSFLDAGLHTYLRTLDILYSHPGHDKTSYISQRP